MQQQQVSQFSAEKQPFACQSCLKKGYTTEMPRGPEVLGLKVIGSVVAITPKKYPIYINVAYNYH